MVISPAPQTVPGIEALLDTHLLISKLIKDRYGYRYNYRYGYRHRHKYIRVTVKSDFISGFLAEGDQKRDETSMCTMMLVFH